MQNPPESEQGQRLRTRREVLAIAALSAEFPAAPPSAEEMFRASAAAARGRLQEAALLNNLAASSTSRTAAVLLNSLALGSPGVLHGTRTYLLQDTTTGQVPGAPAPELSLSLTQHKATLDPTPRLTPHLATPDQ